MSAKRHYLLAFFCNIKPCLHTTGCHKNMLQHIKSLSLFSLIAFSSMHVPMTALFFKGIILDLQHCPLCSASRYVTTDVPAKCYLPIGPRLERLCATANLAQVVHSIRMEIVRVRCVMFTIHLYGEMPTALLFFLEETLEESPSHYTPITGYHSMWPIVLTILPKSAPCSSGWNCTGK